MGSGKGKVHRAQVRAEAQKDSPGSVRTIQMNGRKEWHSVKSGELHRVDGPAIEDTNGYRAWYINGDLHRVGGPACEFNDGRKDWWEDGHRHQIGRAHV